MGKTRKRIRRKRIRLAKINETIKLAAQTVNTPVVEIKEEPAPPKSKPKPKRRTTTTRKKRTTKTTLKKEKSLTAKED